MEKFWMVWNPSGRAPAFKHNNPSAARAEAERLVRENPGFQFYVLEAVSMVAMQPVTAPVWSESMDIPF